MDPQEGDVADDGKGNYLVYRGGEWFAAQQDGRPKERIPRADYGANHYQLPNGDIVRQGPRNGQETIENFGGAGGGSGGSGLVSADQRGRYNIGASPLVRAERNLATEEREGNPLNRDWGAVILNSVDLDPRGDSSFRPFAPLANIVGGQDYQNAQQALSTYEASLMPIQSGASVTASEAARQIRADFPSLGDSPETLRRKAANRMDRINAIQSGIGKEAAFSPYQIEQGNAGAVEINPETGLPSYDNIAALTAGVDGGNDPDAIAALSGGLPPGPGSGPDSPIDLGSLGPEDLLALKAGQYVRRADGTVYVLSAAPFSAPAQEGDVREGSYVVRLQDRLTPEQRGWTPESAVAQRRDMNPILRNVDAAGRGFADAAGMEFPDEFAAGADAVFGQGVGATVGDRFQNNLRVQRAIDAADGEDVGLARNIGQVAGFGATAAIAAPRFLAQAGTRFASPVLRTVATGVRNALGGAGIAGVAAAGADEGDALQKAQSALRAAPVGAVVGVGTPLAVNAIARPVSNALAPVGRFVQRQVGRAGSALGIDGATQLTERATPNALSTAVDKFGARQRGALGSERRIDEMQPRADALRAEGIEPTFIDAMDSGGRGTMRALGTRPGARETAVDFAESRAVDAPDRASFQARRTVSSDPRSPTEIRDAATATARRQAGPLYDEAYAQPFTQTPLIQDLLNRPAGKAAIARARRIAANEGRNPDELGLFEMIDDGLPTGPSRMTRDADLEGDLDALRSGRRTQGAGRGETLMQFISKNGGVRDDGGDLASIGAGGWNRQGAFRNQVIKEDGLSLEEMAQRARDAGYFDEVVDAIEGNGDNYQRLTSQDLINAMDDELRGAPRFARVAGDTDRSAAAMARKARRDALDERLGRDGIDISRMSNADVARYLRDADDAEAMAMAQMSGEGLGAPQVDLVPGETLSMQSMDYIKRGLDDVLDGYRDSTTGKLNLDTEGRAIQGIQRQLRDELVRVNPAYGQALSAYSDNIRLRRAADIGEKFMTMEADQFAGIVRGFNPAELEVARAAARRAIERAAGAQGSAATTMTRLSGRGEQAARNMALLGEDAGRLSAGMRAERQVLNNAREFNPRAGSESSLNLQDAGAAAGIQGVQDAMAMIRRPITGPIEVVARRFQSRGFSDAEAEALVNAAIDPARTQELISMLSARMSRREARSLARAVQRSLSSGTGSSSVD